jgi:hypothetical protein
MDSERGQWSPRVRHPLPQKNYARLKIFKVLLRGVWGHQCLEPGFSQRCTLSLFCSDRVLDNGSVEPLVWPSWMYLHLVSHIFRIFFLDGSCAYLVEPPPWPIFTWISRRRKIHDNPGVWRRMLAHQHPRSTGHDVANLDGLWHYAWLYRICCFYGCDTPDNSRL